MKRKQLIVVSFIGVLLFIFIAWKGSYIVNMPNLLVGFSAKVGCSLKYVTKLSNTQVREDLSVYSKWFNLVDMVFDENVQSVHSSLLWKKQSATYRTGLGCTLENSDGINLNKLSIDSNLDEKKSNLSVQLDNNIMQQLEEIVHNDKLNGYDTRALLVLKNGNIVGEKYTNNFTKDTLFMGWSMSKTLTGIIIGNMIKNNLLDIDATPLFSEWRNTDKSKITIKDLLTMTSGLSFSEKYEPGTDATRMLFNDVSSWKRAANSKKKYNVGEYWSYSSGSTNILSYLVYEKFSHNPEYLLAYIKKNILSPIGMNNTIVELDPSGSFVGSSFVLGSARDWAILGQFFLNSSSFNSGAIVEDDWIQQSTVPNTSQNDDRFGYHIWLNTGKEREPRWSHLPDNTYAARGSRGQVVLIIPELNTVIVRLGWSKKKYPINAFSHKVIKVIKS
ncbi:hypothetical protein AB835_08485 [Candidatus Endobugula sertula]|uniref:Beta-lactamase-related domain-containing protein n=1 Tax=Candidatus Endobugula sertula TaxID=62101 RepID=A0A1D2QPM8_9GAMM|nr:hypothetical protein AB835_08485 [Candidatus Endobugula sertula]